jgi:hypothetical protein
VNIWPIVEKFIRAQPSSAAATPDHPAEANYCPIRALALIFVPLWLVAVLAVGIGLTVSNGALPALTWQQVTLILGVPGLLLTGHAAVVKFSQ